MGDRRLLLNSVLLLVAVIAVVGGIAFGTHQDEVARQEKIAEASAAAANAAAAAAADAATKYQHIKGIDDSVSNAMSKFQSLVDEVDQVANVGSRASHARHDLYNAPPVDPNEALSDARQELQDVESLKQLSQEKADAARSVATALGAYYGDGTTNALLAQITSAAEAEGKYAADWWRAANQISDSLTAQVNGQFSLPSENIGSLYQLSDEEGVESQSQWATVTAKIADLRSQLEADMAKVAPSNSTGRVVPFGVTSIISPAPASSP